MRIKAGNLGLVDFDLLFNLLDGLLPFLLNLHHLPGGLLLFFQLLLFKSFLLQLEFLLHQLVLPLLLLQEFLLVLLLNFIVFLQLLDVLFVFLTSFPLFLCCLLLELVDEGVSLLNHCIWVISLSHRWTHFLCLILFLIVHHIGAFIFVCTQGLCVFLLLVSQVGHQASLTILPLHFLALLKILDGLSGTVDFGLSRRLSKADSVQLLADIKHFLVTFA